MKIIKNILVFIGVFLIFCLGIELYLRNAEIELSYHSLDPYLGKRIQKNKNIIMLKEGFYLGHSNQYGYLGPAYPEQKNENAFRVALIGDSYTEGLQLFDEYHFRTILENELERYTDKDVQVLNFGNGNFNFSDMYIYYERFAKKFNPDLVIFIIQNEDFENRDSYVPAPYLYVENDSLKINYDFNKKTKFKIYNSLKWLVENSSLFKMVLNTYKLATPANMKKIFFGKFYTGFKESKVERDYSYTARKAMKFEENILKAITKLGHEEKVYFVHKMIFPSEVESYLNTLNIKTLNMNDTLDVLRQSGVETNYWKATKRYDHWNHDAHQAVGKFLTSKLKGEVNKNELIALDSIPYKMIRTNSSLRASYPLSDK